MLLQRLNMDNSWFLDLGGCRLLIDPWLEGQEVDYFPWFNTQRYWSDHILELREQIAALDEPPLQLIQ